MKRLLILLLLIFGGKGLYAQTITGRITTSSDGTTLPGVNISVIGTQIGTTTNSEGNFKLEVPSSNDTLRISFIGYKTREIPISGREQIDIVLKPSTIKGEELEVVGYGTQKETSVTGSISSIGSEELNEAPLANASNLVRGKIPGLITTQRSGHPGNDNATLNIRGFGNPLVIVDGVETSLNHVDPSQIESISVLKDASAAIYGARGGNGVILVTTKSGYEGKPKFSLKSSVTMQGITRMPEPVSSGQYAELEREEWIQSGKPESTAPYTKEEVQKFYAGTDPQYPNTDWYGKLIRNWAPQQKHNLSVRGGNKSIKYYGFLGFLDQGTVWKHSGGSFRRYNLQSKVDAKISDYMSFKLNLKGTVGNRDFTARGQGRQTWGDFWHTSPTVPAEFPDPTKIPDPHSNDGIAPANVSTNRDIWGYRNNEDTDFNGSLSLDYNLKQIKGLSVKGFIDYIKHNAALKFNLNPFKLYHYNYKADKYTIAAVRSKTELTQRKATSQKITGQLSVRYKKTLSGKHHIKALAMYEAIDSKNEFIMAKRMNFITPEIDQLFAGSTEKMRNNGSAGHMGRASYIGRINYDFENKYLLEAILRADASAKFNAENRWGYFPSVSLGWRISNENFMKNLSFLDELKLRASYGRSGNDNVGSYQYLEAYTVNDTYLFNNSDINQGISSTGLANPNLTWEDITIYNAGIDFQFFEKKLYGKTDIFYRELTGIPATRLSTIPQTFGASLPQENINSLNNRGFELQLGTTGNAGDFTWDISGNVSWSRAKWEHFEEPEYTDKDAKRIKQKSGRWTDRVFGYLSDGLFTSQQEIDELKFDQDKKGNSSLRPGDIKYVDVNRDGILDWRDKVELGRGPTPHWMVGSNAKLGYKNFTLAILLQGALGQYKIIDLNPQNKVSPVQRYNLRWTTENNNPNAFVPRIGGSNLNSNISDHRLKSSSYLRLKTLNIGYNIPRQWLNETLGLSEFKVYLSGTNLFTFDSLKKYGADPELPSNNLGLYYPQQRTISLGVNLSF